MATSRRGRRWTDMWLSHVIRRTLARDPQGVALRDLRRTVTWQDLARDVAALAAVLSEAVPPGGRVVLLSGNRVEVLETYFACAVAGVVAAPVNPALTGPEIGYIVNSVQPSLALAEESGRKRLAADHPGLPLLAIHDTPRLPDVPDLRDPIAA